jgi:hypothetical protein
MSCCVDKAIMGCCESKRKNDTQDTLIEKNKKVPTTSRDSNDRGLSLHQSFSPFVGLLRLGSVNHEDSDDEGGIHYEPPQIVIKRKVFEGKSISKPPHLNDLRRACWIDKRGHLVKNWKKRYIELAHEEISYFDKCDSQGKGVNMKGQVSSSSFCL